MTIPELFDHLLKRTINECKEIHRKLILSLNGLAGIFMVKEDYKLACETYKKVLVSVEEHKDNFATDSIQQIHTQHNYLNSILRWLSHTAKDNRSVIIETLEVDDIDALCKELEDKISEHSSLYLQKHNAVEDCTETIKKIQKDILDIQSSYKNKVKEKAINCMNWMNMLEEMGEEEITAFISKLKENLESAPGRGFLPAERFYSSIFDEVRDFKGLTYCLITSSVDLHEQRDNLITAVMDVTCIPSTDMVNKAIQCHLRPTPGLTAPICPYCKADKQFQIYESKLFRFIESSNFDDASSEDDSPNVCFSKPRKGSHSDSEFELVLKFFINYGRHRNNFSIYMEDANNLMKNFDAFKKEFKHLRNTWMKMSSYVAAIDELEMAKTSMRLLMPGEKPPNPTLPYIILPNQLETNMLSLQSDLICHRHALKKKLGQLFYIQNLEKAQNVERKFEESCPICCQNLENTWSVLECGHNFCPSCIQVLISPLTVSSFPTIRCPVCREVTNAKDIYYIGGYEELQADIKGSYSTKITAIVKCLLQIRKEDHSAKSLVFSTWTDLLNILEIALTQNDIPYISFTSKKDFQAQLDIFKCSPTFNVFLLPLHIGANGLNIIEATNVLLVDVPLNNSYVLQAIGRVHRIGQTRKTTVHKFIIKLSIEENIFEAHQSDGHAESMETALTVKDLMLLFNNV